MSRLTNWGSREAATAGKYLKYKNVYISDIKDLSFNIYFKDVRFHTYSYELDELQIIRKLDRNPIPV